MTVPEFNRENLAKLGQSVLNGYVITHDEGLALLHLTGALRYDLFYWANRIRLERFGPGVSYCSIASAKTGNCSEDCKFCAQSSHYPTHTPPTELSNDELLKAGRAAAQRNSHSFGIVTSGRKACNKDIERFGQVWQELRKNSSMRCCAAFGCLTEKQANRLYELGVRNYNHNLETSERFFGKIVSTHTYQDRITTIKAAQSAGLSVCSGGIMGLGEEPSDRVNLALTLRNLGVRDIPLNFLNPIPGTPLSDSKQLKPLEALQTVAMFRFVLPDAEIKMAGGRETCLRDLQSWMFVAGASACMVGNYLTTQGRKSEDDLQMLDDLEENIQPQNP